MAGKKNPYATVLGMELTLEGNALAESNLPRIHRERYDLLNATLKGSENHHFIAAVAKPDPTILSARSLRSAVQRLGEELPVVIYLDRIDPGMKRGLASEGIPFISEDGNVYLPFLGIQETPTLPLPSPLSPQAQRIALNLAAGRWVGVTATELAERCGKSRASVTKYLREIEAIKPALLNTSWRSRILGNDDLSREELLDLFEPYLVTPVKKRHRLATLPDIDVVAGHNARLSGLSALPFFSDLAHDPSRLVVMMGHDDVDALQNALGDAWEETAWYEDAPLVIEEWTYPLDFASDVSAPSTGLKCVDPWSLYAELVNEKHEDSRIEDAVEQLRGRLCQ